MNISLTTLLAKIFSTLFFVGIIITSFAQQYRPMPSSEIFQKLQELNVLGTVMYVAAHPDDENTRLLAYLVHHDHVRTVYLSLTRGDGGQNILGDEQGAALGLIRTHELMEARKIDGAEQVFSRVIDFGFTKSPEETFKFWNKADVVSDVKAAFDLYHPDVVITRFPTTGEGGHGQHTASAIAAGEAFAEKDGWQPIRLLFNSFRFGDRNTTSEDQFKMLINQYDPLLGEGYGEMAGRSRSIHKSQGAGTPQTVGFATEYFKLIAGKPVKTSLYDDIDMTWNRVGHPEIGIQLQKVIADFDFKNPSASIPALLTIRAAIKTVKDEYWRSKKMDEINNIILSCAGVMAELVTGKEQAVPGESVDATLNILARSAIAVKISKIELPTFDKINTVDNTMLQNDSLYTFPMKLTVPESEDITEPYWLKYDAQPGAYQYDRKVYKGAPEAENPLTAHVVLTIGNQEIAMPVPLSCKKLDPVKGDVVQRLLIVPPVSVEPLSGIFIYERGKPQKKWVRVRAFKNIDKANLIVSNNTKQLVSVPISNLLTGKDTLIALDIPTDNIDPDEQNSFILYTVAYNGKEYNHNRRLITYPHLPELQYFTGAWSKAVEKDWKVAVKKIGYIPGAGDMVASVLTECGLDVERVPPSYLSNADYLKSYDAIVIGVRAFNTQESIGSWMPVLMQYVQNGGNLVVQYNTSRGLQSTDYGPYPFSLSGDRVTDEEAHVTFTDPNSTILNYPNKITEKDFEHWVQERGIYFPTGWDAHYQTMLAMHDAGESDLNGGILYTPYGKGNYVYTSLVFFRELPAANKGAIRLMMNLLSAGKK